MHIFSCVWQQHGLFQCLRVKESGRDIRHLSGTQTFPINHIWEMKCPSLAPQFNLTQEANTRTHTQVWPLFHHATMLSHPSLHLHSISSRYPTISFVFSLPLPCAWCRLTTFSPSKLQTPSYYSAHSPHIFLLVCFILHSFFSSTSSFALSLSSHFFVN